MSTSTNATEVPADPLALLPKVPALDNTFGAVLLGTFIALILYGITLHQSYRYFRMYPADLPSLKWLVSFVVVLETVTSAMSMHVCYHYLVSSYFNPPALLRGMWSIDLFPVISGIVMVSTQSFFVRRVYVLGRGYRIFVVFAVFLCFIEMGFFIAATTEAFIIPTFEGFKHVTWLVSTGSTMAVTSDIIITTMLIFALRQSRTGVKRTDSMLDVMIMYSINTGLLTGIFNLLSLLFAFIRPGDLIYIGFGIPGTKMYANTLMAALNSRRSLAAKGSGMVYDTSPFGVSGVPDSHENGTPMARIRRKAHHVDVESAAQTDSIVDITKPTLVGDSAEDVRTGDVETGGRM
ncbi:hypothetical protein GSI_05480 [Ganoderma sinense ZZ0214-1]|uniref:DUF6534 domain-containing protein n=1 Tax=Ganoderma sinense ZZ0214-1 TaxID=1077348 RepID=A0A2G8SEN5_9APHY|nr:hypothetical protein GSI_05480 [Ganoderma sinense ZZ0214-1]